MQQTSGARPRTALAVAHGCQEVRASFLSSTSESTRNSLQYVYSLPSQSLICSISTFRGGARECQLVDERAFLLPEGAATKLSMRMARP